MTRDISKTIVFIFTNKFTKQEVLTWSLPYLPFWAAQGHYSKMFKRIKAVAADKFEKSLLVGKHYFETGKSDRAVISFPNGMKLNFPYDVSDKDVEIITHQLEGLKMAASE